MPQPSRITRVVVVGCVGVVLCMPAWCAAENPRTQPIRRTVDVVGIEREYYVRVPRNFDKTEQYWLLVVVHGGGGNGRTFFLAEAVRRVADELGLDAIVVSPSFRIDENVSSRFPVLGEGEFLNRMIDELRREYRLRPKVLLTGYSRGGQFTHRFTFANPNVVKASAPLASGTWSTPDGKLLLESVGEVPDPESFLTSTANASMVPARLQDLFDPRVAEVAALPAKPGTEQIPFLVMCGRLDPRFSIAQQFARSLAAHGYKVETGWPRTPHGREASAAFDAEFEKYSRRTVEFFLRVTEEQ